ncbi:MAG: NADH-quinone oxidoreductase subunit C [Candidatus Omnitrophota bacterium]|nr:NADH-quinone oxidoreductase subunit C [Candidatus Omnitrophota bacterium]
MNNQDRIKQITDRFPDNSFEISEQDGSLVIISPLGSVYELCEFLKKTLQYNYLQFLTCVDMSYKLQLQYYLYSYSHKGTAIIKISMKRLGGRINSVSSIWKTADWLEREVYDLFGVTFKGHPGLERILLENDFQGHPLLKDYSNKNMIKLPKV